MPKVLRLVRVQIIDAKTKLPKEDVDILTSAKGVLFSDGMSIEEKWEKGEFTGAAGEDGSAATIKVGETITAPPGTKSYVENIGTKNAAVLNFTIPRGDKGEDGTSIKILARFDTYEELVATYPDGSELDGGFLVGPEGGPCNYYFWNNETNAWESMGPIKGEKGDPGKSGAPGEDGHGLAVFDTVDSYQQLIQLYPDGSVCNGLGVVTLNTKEYWYWNIRELKWISLGQYIGPSGPQGDRGPSGTITIKQVNTVDSDVPASIINEGTKQEAQLVFNIPKGEKSVITTDILVSGEQAQKDAFDPLIDSVRVINGQIDISKYDYDFYVFYFQYKSTSNDFYRDRSIWVSKDQLINFDRYNNQFKPTIGNSSWYEDYVLSGQIGSINDPCIGYYYLNGILKYCFNAVHGKYCILGYKCDLPKDTGNNGSSDIEDVKLIYLTFHHDSNESQIIECAQDSTITVPVCKVSINGKTWVGWATRENATNADYPANSTINPTSNLELWPVYSVKTYTVNWYNGSSLVKTMTCIYNQNITMPSTSKTDYTFNGWSTSSSATSAQYAAGSSYAVRDNVNFYAVFTVTPKKSYTIKLYKYGSLYDTITTDQTTTSATATLPSCTPDSGETFKGWTKSNGGTTIEYTNSITVSENTNLYAIFEYTDYEYQYSSYTSPEERFVVLPSHGPSNPTTSGLYKEITDAAPNSSYNAVLYRCDPYEKYQPEIGSYYQWGSYTHESVSGTADENGKIIITISGINLVYLMQGYDNSGSVPSKGYFTINYNKLTTTTKKYRSSK